MAVGDFNKDGIQDLVLANKGVFPFTTLSDVSVLLGSGDGTFSLETRFGAGSAPHSVAVEDFNADGRPDIAVANFESDDISVLLNETIYLEIQALCEIVPSSLHLQAQGKSLSIRTTLIDIISGNEVDPSLLAPTYISRVSSPSVGDLILPTPRAEPGCDDFTEDGIWENVGERRITGSGSATLRFNQPSDGQCETMDGDRQDIIAVMLDIPNGENGTICYMSTYPGNSGPFECCGVTKITNHGNR